MENEAKLWMQFAETNLGTAKHLMDTYYPKPLEIICYHSQQAAEMAIKALIIYHGAQGGLPKKHNLSFLLEQMKNMVNIPEEYYDYADILTPYGVSARYPNELFLEEQDAEEALVLSEKILVWVKGLIMDENI